MTNNLSKAVTRNPHQLTNYCSVEIAEFFKDCPEGKDIAAIEQVLKQFRKMILTQERQAA